MKITNNVGRIRLASIIGGVIAVTTLVVGTVIIGFSSTRKANEAAEKVGQFYNI